MTVDMDRKQTSASRVIDAPPGAVFAVLQDPTLHSVIDGSGSVRGARSSTERLELGSTFSMKMRIAVPYVISSTVVEFEQDRLIAWEHFGKHRWRWELEPVEGGTKVTETFDWSTSRSPWVLEQLKYPQRHEPNIERTLDRLEAFLVNKSKAL